MSELPLNFISGTRNFLHNIQTEKQHKGPIFGSPNSPKINDVINSAQKRDTLENFFLKIDIIEPRAGSTLAPIYDTTFLFDSFSPVKGEIAPKEKSLTPIFSETSVNFRNFLNFTISNIIPLIVSCL